MFSPQMFVQMLLMQNPNLQPLWNQAQQMVNGKTPEQQKQMVNNLSQEMGITPQQIMNQYSH